jgi:hypothetical protein
MTGAEAVLKALGRHRELWADELYDIAHKYARNITRHALASARYQLERADLVRYMRSSGKYTLTAVGRTLTGAGSSRSARIATTRTRMLPLSKLRDAVERDSIGIYILSRDGTRVHYVGRSDTDVRQRLKQSVKEGEGYRYFRVSYTSSARSAYYTECRLWHRHQPVDNSIHPAVPGGQNWRCPVAGCDWGY